MCFIGVIIVAIEVLYTSQRIYQPQNLYQC